MTKREAGPVKRSAGFYNQIKTGTLTVSFPAVALSATSDPIFEVIVQNAPVSAVPIFIGNQDQGQFVEVVAGQSLTMPASDLDMVFVRTDGSNATVNWMAMA